ncbi:MAG: hypothetical protein JXX28_10695 [Deltaproteobacteria bacterium]|nr:hypothetical protein [Deltaproteobacteria bacterium]
MVVAKTEERSTGAGTPALVTGTSTEFLGGKPIPRRVRERRVVFVLGPPGSGKTSVARRLSGTGAHELDAKAVQAALVDRIGALGWSEELLSAPSLVLDGPVWLRNRPAVVEVLCELLTLRAEAGLRTVVCQADRDASIHLLVGALAVHHYVVLGLRLPVGRRGRMRFARRMCDKLGLEHGAARGTADIEPWSYAAVARHLRAWQHLPFGG